jgi:hypothetical protein
MKKISCVFSFIFACGLLSCHSPASKPSVESDTTVVHHNRVISEKPISDTAATMQADTTINDAGHYSHKELERAMTAMERKWLKGTPANGVVSGFGLRENDISVSLIFDSPKNRALVRKYLIDAPFITFEGEKKPRRISISALTDTMHISLESGKKVYPHHVETVSARLYNGSKDSIIVGKESDLAFLDAHGVWRALPMHRAWTDIAIIIPPGQTHVTTTNLSPEAFPTPSGRYRYYYPIYLKGNKIWLMTAFRVE